MKNPLSISQIMQIDGYTSEVTSFTKGVSGKKQFVDFRIRYENGSVTGTISASITQIGGKDLFVDIDSIRTEPSKRGLGSLIVQRTRNLAQQIGAKEVRVDSLKGATEFWKKVGLVGNSSGDKGIWFGRLVTEAVGAKERL